MSIHTFNEIGREYIYTPLNSELNYKCKPHGVWYDVQFQFQTILKTLEFV